MSRIDRARRTLSCFAALGTVLVVGGCGSSGSSDSGSGGGLGGSVPGGGGGATGGAGGVAPFSCTSSGDVGAMVEVLAGEFTMGCNAAVDASCKPDEQPSRTVTVASFEIDVTEVTQDQYAGCVQAGACAEPECQWSCDASSLPASCLDWARAKTYCAWAGKRLPTEAEWEKAARGADGRTYPWGNEEPDCTRTNMAGCAGGLEPVGSHPSGASPYGALDMSGNMVEMIADWYDAAYYATGPNVDPQGPANGTKYGGRGGGFKSTAEWQRAACRDWYDLEDAGPSLGFRCAR